MEKIKNYLNKIIEKIKNHNKKKFLLAFIFIFFGLFFVFSVFVQATNYVFDNIASPGTFFLDHDISFKNKKEIYNIIKTEKDKILNTLVVFNIEDDKNNKIIRQVSLSNLLETNSEDKIIEEVFNDFKKTKISLNLFFENIFNKKKFYNLGYSLKTDELEKIKNDIKRYEKQTVNASIYFDDKKLEFVIKNSEIGMYYDFSKLENDILDYINLKNKKSAKYISINIDKKINNPEILEDNLKTTIEQSNILLKNSPFIVYYNNKDYSLDKKGLVEFIDFEYKINDNKVFEEVSLKIKKEKVYDLLNTIAKENDKEPENGEVVINGNKVSKFIPISKGTSLDIEESYNKIQDAILSTKNNISLIIKDNLPKDIDSDVVKYGFLEKISEGVSDFSGSPKNRVHNIKTGTGYLEGIVVKPSEEFSLVKTLKKVDASMGYLPELVIKGNKTEYEYGGGLCQVGTTIFRAALNGGFPIVERKNHSYRVPYYEPAGTDATIYFPKPDFRFLNDTKNHILVLTEIRGYKLYYSIWGTKDNRKVFVGEPVITNIVMAPKTKWIETLDLKPGEIKCTESSHNGADAEFSYKIEYPDGTKKETTFKSRYRPWQAVCMKGVEKLTEIAKPEESIESLQLEPVNTDQTLDQIINIDSINN